MHKNGIGRNNRSGFVSVYFLSIFLSISIITGISTYNSANRMRAADNHIETLKYLSQENAVCSEVKCLMKNEALESGTYESKDMHFEMDVQSPRVTVLLTAPLYEIIIFTIQEENSVILDMETIRDATVA